MADRTQNATILNPTGKFLDSGDENQLGVKGILNLAEADGRAQLFARMPLLPELPRDTPRIDFEFANLIFVSGLVQLPMVTTVEWHREIRCNY